MTHFRSQIRADSGLAARRDRESFSGRNPDDITTDLHGGQKKTPDRLATILALLLTPLMLSSVRGDDWRQFRGNESNGVAADSDRVTRARVALPPVRWSETENIAWRADLPGHGPSSPIVVAGHVIVTASSGTPENRLHVVSYSAATGKLEWHRQFWATGRTMVQPTTAVAAPTPASDGSARVRPLLLRRSGLLRSRRQPALATRLANRASGGGKRCRHGVVAVGRRLDGDRADRESGRFIRGRLRRGLPARRAGRSRGRGWAIGRRRSCFAARAVADDLVLLQSTTGVSAVDPLTGEERWSHRAACNDITSAAADGDTLFVPATGIQALRLDPRREQPHPLWNAPEAKLRRGQPRRSPGANLHDQSRRSSQLRRRG